MKHELILGFNRDIIVQIETLEGKTYCTGFELLPVRIRLQ